MAELMYDPEFGISILNDTDVDNSAVFRALSEQAPEVAQMVRWSYDTKPSGMARYGGLFDRDRYVSPTNIFGQFQVAYDAAENDDVVSGIVESTEALAFNKMSIDCEDADEANLWEQISDDLDIDSRLREMWREDFIVSQFYAAVWWGQKSYKLKGKSDAGVTRKKTFDNLQVPLGISILDPMKIVPVGNLLFNQQQLAYVADQGREMDVIQAVVNGQRGVDPMLEQLMLSHYHPDVTENTMLSQDGIPTGRLFLLNPENVWRHTSTRSQYKRWASVRMKSVFELLDLKHQLRQMDRAHLLGATNFIVLVKKGNKDRPGTPAEIQALQGQVRSLARVPVIVGDDRLSIEIITPETDTTLQPEKYNGLDARITARLFQMFMTGNFAAGAKGDDSVKLAKLVARGLESRRHMIRRAVERNILNKIYERNDSLTCEPELRFHPKRIALDFDPTFAQFLLDLRDRGDLSRESILEEVDFDQLTEWQRRKYEKEKYDDIFETTIPYTASKGTPDPTKVVGGAAQPAGAPNKRGPAADPKAAGRRLGGNKGGGGAAPGSGQGKAPVNPAKKSDGTTRAR